MAVLAGSGRSFWTLMAIGGVMRIASIVDVIRVRRETQSVPSWGKVAVVWLAMLLVAGAESAWARATRAEAFKIPSGGMIPTLQVDDHMFVAKTPWQPARGDVIVFRYPRDPEKDFVKRVLAIPGDTIRFDDDMPVVNGQPVSRKPLGGSTYWDYDEVSGSWQQRRCLAFEEALDGHVYTVVQDVGGTPRSARELQVPPGSVYVVGDNRDNSSDSRIWGFVPLDHVKGRALFLWWSTGPDGVRWDRVNQPIR
jgi:signal peptidase I